VNAPISYSVTFDQNRQKEKFEYSRTANPTRLALERNLAALEEGKHALAFASGLAAETTLMTVLKADYPPGAVCSHRSGVGIFK